MLNTIDKIIEAASNSKNSTISVAAAHDVPVIEAVVEAKRKGLVTPLLVGHKSDIEAMLSNLDENPESYEIFAADSDVECAEKAVELCASGKANFLMKGLLGTADLLRAVFNKEHGLRTSHLTTHCMLYDIPGYKMICLTDGGVNTFPDFDKKVEILENAAIVMQALGYEHINAACVCGAEVVNPKVQSTVDADELSKLTDRWAKYNMDVIGPVGFDLAFSKDACHHKHYDAPGAGDCDILLVPNYEVGNGIGKCLGIFGNSKNAGIILGAKVPIVLVSRSDSAEVKMSSIALGSVLASKIRFE